ncbi:polymeric immunoglobulin receptor isoform X1 [Lates calcarifer]|uniref:polymeric immunoglobulin receptor isoform X1 n=1 Tax=Lates calcarifer TaxID=8187 RepID=UPI0021D7BE05|nr:polymeric immunoglobulin receptor isoform X1 [Lates calcarifer]
MNKMRSFLLLVLSLLTGCEATSELRGCAGGWIEFMCNYSTTTGQNQSFVIESPHLTTEDRSKGWDGRFHLYNDTKNKKVKLLVIKQLSVKDAWKYSCKPDTRQTYSVKVNLTDGKNGCQEPFNQTAYRTAKTTIICDYPENKDKSRLKFFCKDTNGICEEILSTESSKSLNKRFTLTGTKRGFNISISNVSSDDAGVYWCGVKSNDKYHRAARKKIQLEVQGITNFTRSPTVGQNISYWCKYQTNNPPTDKFICKGEDPSICQHLVSTTQPNMDNGKFSMKDDTGKRNITITVRNLTTDDTGTYWCGAETTDKGRSNLFFNRLLMTVGPPSTPGPSHGGFDPVIIVTVCVPVLLQLLVLILVLIGKRFSDLNNTRNEAKAQHIREVQNSSDSVGGEGLIPRPNSSASEYTTVEYR